MYHCFKLLKNTFFILAILIIYNLSQLSVVLCSELEDFHDDVTNMGFSLGYVCDCLVKADIMFSETPMRLSWAVMSEASYVFEVKKEMKTFDISVVKKGEDASKDLDDLNICKKHLERLIQIGGKYNIFTINHFKVFLKDFDK